MAAAAARITFPRDSTRTQTMVGPSNPARGRNAHELFASGLRCRRNDNGHGHVVDVALPVRTQELSKHGPYSGLHCRRLRSKCGRSAHRPVQHCFNRLVDRGQTPHLRLDHTAYGRRHSQTRADVRKAARLFYRAALRKASLSAASARSRSATGMCAKPMRNTRDSSPNHSPFETRTPDSSNAR
jgi:hypothetical protein